MPKPTFFNLPSDKRQAILQWAVEEFAEHDYPNASISNIVAQAGIAKGSFYQYFADKQDLYGYLLQLAAEEKQALFRESPPPNLENGVFAYLNWLFEAGVRFEFMNPRLSKIGYRAMFGSGVPVALVQEAKASAGQFFRQLVERGIAQGEFEPSLDVDLAAYVFNAVLQELGGYMMRRLDILPQDIIAQRPFPLDSDEARALFAELMRLLQHGMGHRHDGRPTP